MPGPNEKDIRINVIIDEDVRGAQKATKALAATRKESDKLGDSFQDVARDAKSLDDRLKILYEQRRSMALKLSETEDREVQKEHSRVNRRIALLEKLKRELGDGPGTSVDLNPFPVGSPGFVGGPAGVAAAGAVAIPALAATAELLGAMVSGILAGGVVAVGLAGGIAAATRDGSVRGAAKSFGKSISEEFFASGDSFVAPIQLALNELKGGFNSLNLDEVFERAAPALVPFARGISALANNMMPGFNKVLDLSTGIGAEFEEGLGDIGQGLGELFSDIANSKGTLSGLEATFDVIAGTLRGTGEVLAWLGDGFDRTTTVLGRLYGVMEDFPLIGDYFADANDQMEDWSSTGEETVNVLARYNPAAAEAARETERIGAAAKGSAKWVDTLTGAFNNFYDLESAKDDTTIAMKQAFLDFGETLKENGKHWEDNTQAGLDNQAALRGVVDAIKAKRDAEVAASDGSQKAIDEINRKYDKNIALLKDAAVKAGITEQAFKNLAGSYTVNLYVKEFVSTSTDWSEFRSKERKAEGKASGGPVMAGVPYMINEAGRETVTFPANGTVHPANLTPATGGGAVGGSVTLNIIPGAEQRVRDFIYTVIRDGAWTLGGGSVQKAYGRN
jgi:hypothetical protein